MSAPCPLCSFDEVEEIGLRSELHTLQGYAKYVADLKRFDRVVCRCLTCGLQFIHPMYNADDLDALYNHEGYNCFLDNTMSVSNFDDARAKHLMNIWKNQFVMMGIGEWQAAFQERHQRKPTFLDVGCGRGRNLLIFRQLGFEVTGIDLSAEQVEFARTELKADVKLTSLEDYEAEDTYDCILASHVVEHVTDPHYFMVKLCALLSAEGLLILETPLTDDRGKDQDRYRDIYHTLFFDHFTLALLGGMHGLDLDNCNTILHSKPGTIVNHAIVRASLTRNSDLQNVEWCPRQIRILRASYDSIKHDFLRLGRSDLALRRLSSDGSVLQRLLHNGLSFLREHGAWATIKQTVFLIWDYYIVHKRENR